MAGKPYFEQKPIYRSGTEGYHTLRIPAIVVTTKGTILAFCEGRKHSMSDTGAIEIVLKRSLDGGETWSKLQVVWSDHGNTCGNPCPVVDSETGTVWLLMNHNLGSDDIRPIIAGTSKGTRSVWATKSTDDGVTWSDPVEITKATKDSDWRWHSTGPGAGTQLKSGRLTIPCCITKVADEQFYSYVIYSDDHGATWRRGEPTPGNKVTECEAVELEDGTLLLNMRSHDTRPHCRSIARSKDGGLTWSEVSQDETLIEPFCQASIRRLTWKDDGGRSRILFSNPADAEARMNMTVRLSYDECKTWPAAKQLHAGPSAYSCLAVLPDRTAACLYECGEKHRYGTVTLARFNVEWLTDGRDRRGKQ